MYAVARLNKTGQLVPMTDNGRPVRLLPRSRRNFGVVADMVSPTTIMDAAVLANEALDTWILGDDRSTFETLAADMLIDGQLMTSGTRTDAAFARAATRRLRTFGARFARDLKAGLVIIGDVRAEIALTAPDFYDSLV